MRHMRGVDIGSVSNNTIFDSNQSPKMKAKLKKQGAGFLKDTLSAKKKVSKSK